MAVIADARLIERRLTTLREQREHLAEPAGVRAPLPDWAADTLIALGMTRSEIETADADAASAEPETAVDGEIADTDEAIAALEQELLARGSGSLGAVHSLAEIALARLKRSIATDPRDVFYDEGEARAIWLFEHVVGQLGELCRQDYRHTA